MAEPILQVANIILSNALLYAAPLNTALPADTVPFGGSWGGTWARVGFTSAPLKMGYAYTSAEASIEESLAMVNRGKKDEGASFETVMAELNLKLLPYAWGGITSEIAQSTGVAAVEVWDIGGSNVLQKLIWGFEGQWVKDDGSTYPVRFFIWRGTATAGGELNWTKEKYVEGIPLKIGALADMNRAVGQRLMQARRITTAAG